MLVVGAQFCFMSCQAMSLSLHSTPSYGTFCHEYMIVFVAKTGVPRKPKDTQLQKRILRARITSAAPDIPVA